MTDVVVVHIVIVIAVFPEIVSDIAVVLFAAVHVVLVLVLMKKFQIEYLSCRVLKLGIVSNFHYLEGVSLNK